MFKKQITKIILSIDPSLSATGWAILSSGRSLLESDAYALVDYGWIKTSKNKDKKVSVGRDDMDRARKIASELFLQIRKNKVTEIYSEIPLGSQSASASKALGIVKGILAAIACTDEYDCCWMNPLQIKEILCGDRYAKKEKVIREVEKIFPALRIDPRRKKRTGKFSLFHEAICDAIAVTLAIKKSDS